MTRPHATPESWAALPTDGLCLDFANTLYWRGTEPPTETLRGPADLLAWSEAAGALDPGTLARLRGHWTAHPRAASTAFAAAIALREVLFRLFAAATTGAAPSDAVDLRHFNAALGKAPARTRLGRMGGADAWVFPALAPDVATLLAPVLWSAGDLLAGPRRARVRQCANPQCRYLFLDDSKSANRRWCSMATCGNRAKAHRHYAKAKRGGQAPAPAVPTDKGDGG